MFRGKRTQAPFERRGEGVGEGVRNFSHRVESAHGCVQDQRVGHAPGTDDIPVRPRAHGVHPPVEHPRHGQVCVPRGPVIRPVFALQVLLVEVDSLPVPQRLGKKVFAPLHRGRVAVADRVDAERPEQSALRIDEPPLAIDFLDPEKAAGLQSAVTSEPSEARALLAGSHQGGRPSGVFPSVFAQLLLAVDLSGPVEPCRLTELVHHRQGERVEQRRLRAVVARAARLTDLDSLAGGGFRPLDPHGDLLNGGRVHGRPVVVVTPRIGKKPAQTLHVRMILGEGLSGQQRRHIQNLAGANQETSRGTMGPRLFEITLRTDQHVKLGR